MSIFFFFARPFRAIVTAFLVMLLSLSACHSDDESMIEGKTAKLNITFSAGIFPVESITRGAVSAVEENKVHNLYVFIFNADGMLADRYFFDEAPPSGSLTLATKSGDKNVCIIANLGIKQPVHNITKEALDNISTRHALTQLIVAAKPEIATIDRTDGKLLMSGTKDITVQPGGIAVNQLTVPLKRVCAKVAFTMQKSSNVNIKSFTPLRWKLMRAPLKIRLMEDAGIGNANGGVTNADDFFDTSWRAFEENEPGGKSSFTYYQVENRKEPLKSVPGTGNTARNLREKQVKTVVGNSATNGAYEYADPNASYVVIEGKLEMLNGSSTIFADVRYTVHLGYLGSNANDFDCKRNTFYKYTLTVNGVNDIKVEAQASDPLVESIPGVEGKVLEATTSYVFDCHYVTCIVKLNRSVADAAAPYYVNTPFDTHGTTDINWVKFMKNPISDPNIIQTYPGETSSSLLNPSEVFALIKEKKEAGDPNFFDASGDAYFTVFINEFFYDKRPGGTTSEPLLWREFTNQPDRELVIAGAYQVSPDGKSSYTSNAYLIKQSSIKTSYDNASSDFAAGFEQLDENWGEMYTTDETTSKGNDSPDDGWKNSCLDWELVTGDPRTAPWTLGRLWANYIDPNAITKPQIATNPKQFAWGTNVLANTGTGFTRNKARYACMARNRDLNGNRVIDKDEVRWYLPAINQLANIWIGSGVVDRQDQLYRTPDYYVDLGRYPYVLYMSSTTAGVVSGSSVAARSNPKVIWSKEGTSISPLSGPADANWLPLPSVEGGVTYSGSYGKLPRNKYYTRCVRNLGGDASRQPDSFNNYEPGSRIISVVSTTATKIDQDSYRSTAAVLLNAEYPPHNERSPENKPAAKFQVATSLLNSNASYTWTALRTGTPSSGCWQYQEKMTETGRGAWRMPNQRELFLMSKYGLIPETVWSATNYTYNGAYNTPAGTYGGDLGGRDRAFGGATSGLTLLNKTDSKQVRCVRDVKE